MHYQTKTYSVSYKVAFSESVHYSTYPFSYKVNISALQGAFDGASGLAEISIPSGVGITAISRVQLVGPRLGREIVDALIGRLAPGAIVLGPELVGQRLGEFEIIAQD